MRATVMPTAALLTCGCLVPTLLAGEIDPPGAPGPTMSPLSEVEPRRSVHTVPGSVTAQHVINQSGSYALAESITGESGKSGIEIAADDVTLDLRGFSLVGVAGSLSGITVPNQQFNVSIRSGTVRDWGEHGVDAREADNSELLDLRALNNGTPSQDHDGLRLGEGGVIARCVANGHPAEGIEGDDGTTIIACSAGLNLIGIRGSGCTVADCSATANTFGGISVSFGTVRGCTASLNTGHGIRIDRGTVVDCTASRNGTNGIWVNSESAIRGNTCSENFSGAGIFAGNGPASATIEGNTVSANQRGIQVTASGNFVIRNTAHGNTMGDFDIGTGNAFGPIVNVAGAGDITTLITINQSHPWANFSF